MDAVFNPEVRLQRADILQMSGIKEEVLPERQDRSSSLNQEDPEPPNIKEEQEDPEPISIKYEHEELMISQEGEQLQEREEAGNKFSFTPVRSRDDDEEGARFSNSTKTAGRKPTRNAMENTRASTHFWTEEQTEFMLNVLKELNILKFMDGRKTRNGGLFKKVSVKMSEAGFPRTPEQIRIRWKNLKKAFFQAKRDNGASGRGRATCPSFDVLDDLLGGRPLSLVERNGVESGGQLPTTMDTTMDPEEALLGGSPGSSSPRSTTHPSSVSPLRATSSVRSTLACTPPPSSAPLRPAITDDPPGTRAQRSRRRRDVDVLVNQMQIMTREWREDMARSEAREERLIAAILRTDSMVERLMQKMENIQPQPNTFSPPPQPQPNTSLYFS